VFYVWTQSSYAFIAENYLKATSENQNQILEGPRLIDHELYAPTTPAVEESTIKRGSFIAKPKWRLIFVPPKKKGKKKKGFHNSQHGTHAARLCSALLGSARRPHYGKAGPPFIVSARQKVKILFA